MHQNLSLNEKVLNQQKEELHTMMEVRRKVSEYQKQKKADQVKRFSLMELKRFQVILNSGENLMEEAGGIILDAKKECDRIWESASTLMEEEGLPRMEKSKTISPKDARMEMVETTHRVKRETLQHLKELRWEDIKSLLVDEIRSQTQIEAWIAGAEVNMWKRIMKSVCQSNLMLEGYKVESLVPLMEAHDQWETFFNQRDNTQSEAGGPNEALKIIELDTSE